MPLDDRARKLAKEWVAAADRQLELAAMAFERQMWNEAVALSAGATERLLKAILTSANQPFADGLAVGVTAQPSPSPVRPGAASGSSTV
jgi:hypothetical protein